MREQNVTMSPEMCLMLDSVLELFDGKMTYTELMDMSPPTLRALSNARLQNISTRKTPATNAGKRVMQDLLKSNI